MSTPLSAQILKTLEHRQPAAAFVTEIAAMLRPGPGGEQLEATLRDLGTQRQVLVMDHDAPDIHLHGIDLRVVARVPAEDGEPAALDAAEAHWNTWLRAFLSTHRCQ
jgi:hypothetical protein